MRLYEKVKPYKLTFQFRQQMQLEDRFRVDFDRMKADYD